MAERHVLVTVKIATLGAHCGIGETPCPYLETRERICSLFHEPTPFVYRKGWERAPACLALDDRELTPEEAMAHGFGSQP